MSIEPLFPEFATTEAKACPFPPDPSRLAVPAEWHSDDIMISLSGVIGEKSSHPFKEKVRKGKIDFWVNLLLDAFRRDSRLEKIDPIITIDMLRVLFLRKGVAPLGLQDILVRSSRLTFPFSSTI